MTAEGSTQTFEVFNLEFPSWCDRIELRGYTFTRLEDYVERVRKLQHRNEVHAEFRSPVGNGVSIATALVSVPTAEPPAVFAGKQGETELDDILLLFSILTQRDVFTAWGSDESGESPRRLPSQPEGTFLTPDPRCFEFGGVLRNSIPVVPVSVGPRSFNGGLQRALEGAMTLTRETTWRERNGDGRFLLLFREAVASHRLESAFTLCWTMWEHLFYVRNAHWVDPKDINARDKVLFVMTEILGLPRRGKLPARVEELVRTRNRLIHFGLFPESQKRDVLWYIQSAHLFVELSEMLVVRLLELGEPSQIIGTQRRLAHWVETGEHPAPAFTPASR